MIPFVEHAWALPGSAKKEEEKVYNDICIYRVNRDWLSLCCLQLASKLNHFNHADGRNNLCFNTQHSFMKALTIFFG